MSDLKMCSRAHGRQAQKNDRPGSYYKRYLLADTHWKRKADRLLKHLARQPNDPEAMRAIQAIERDHASAFVWAKNRLML